MIKALLAAGDNGVVISNIERALFSFLHAGYNLFQTDAEC